MNRWNLAVCFAAFGLLFVLIAIIAARPAATIEAIPPEVHTDGPAIVVKDAPEDVSADAEPMAFEQTPVPTPASIDADELDLLARLITGEMGMRWAPDEQQLNVGSVALNRVASPLFPDTLEEVINQPGQYACAGYLSTLTPDDRTIANARQLLEDGSVLPAGVVFQSEAPQGPVYASYYDAVLGTTTYYCTAEG